MRNLLIVTSLACVLVGCATSKAPDGARSPATTPTSDAAVENADIMYIIDGRNATRAEFEKLPPEHITQIEVIKGNAATQRYGIIGRRGVVSVTTLDSNTRSDRVTTRFPADVLYFINGRAVTRADVEALAVESIQSIEIIKGKSAVFLYGPDAHAGAILVTLKPTR